MKKLIATMILFIGGCSSPVINETMRVHSVSATSKGTYQYCLTYRDSLGHTEEFTMYSKEQNFKVGDILELTKINTQTYSEVQVEDDLFKEDG